MKRIVIVSVLALAVLYAIGRLNPRPSAPMPPAASVDARAGQPPAPAQQRPRSYDGKLLKAAPCGVDLDATGEGYAAMERNDKAAVSGLLARGRLLALDSGDAVHVIGAISGLAQVRVRSGYHAGEKCWLPEKLIAIF